MFLTMAPKSREVRIVKNLAEGGIRRYLESLGVTAGETLRVLSCDQGNVICVVKGSRLAFDRKLAEKIIVE